MDQILGVGLDLCMSSGMPENSLESLGITRASDLNLRPTRINLIPKIVQKRASERG